MSRIRAKDTEPEKLVRSMLHRLGFRFRVHRYDLPGCPDIVLPKHRAVVLVHGCFWHRHKECRFATSPKTNAAFWKKKFRENVGRDKRNVLALRRLGWRVIIIWQCEVERAVRHGSSILERRMLRIRAGARR